MSLSDTYIPAEILHCPVCGEELSEWQGKDGPCGLFVWIQNTKAPIAQNAAESNLDDADRVRITLPDKFKISCYDCNCQYSVQAIGSCSEKKWTKTILITSENATQHKEESMRDFQRRLRWLRGEAT